MKPARESNPVVVIGDSDNVFVTAADAAQIMKVGVRYVHALRDWADQNPSHPKAFLSSKDVARFGGKIFYRLSAVIAAARTVSLNYCIAGGRKKNAVRV